MASEPPPTEGAYCNRTWDGLFCWPNTPVGTTTIQSCPNYINMFDVRENASRECLQNGSWFYHPVYNGTWSNYTQCRADLSPVQELTLFMKKHLNNIKLLYSVGYGTSLLALVLALVIMLLFRNNQTSLQIGGSKHPPTPHWECKLLFTIFHYVIGANYTWILMEGVYLHMIIFVSVCSEKEVIKWYMLCGWTCPLVFIIPWIVLKATFDDIYCWNTQTNKHFAWLLRGPNIVMCLINFAIFVNIVRVLCAKLKAGTSQQAKRNRYKKLARTTLVLIPLFGVHYVLFVSFNFIDKHLDQRVEVAYLYLEMFFTSFLGFVVALLFCFLNNEVQNELRRAWERLKAWGIERRSTRHIPSGMSIVVVSKHKPASWKHHPHPGDIIPKKEAHFHPDIVNKEADFNSDFGSNDLISGENTQQMINSKYRPTRKGSPHGRKRCVINASYRTSTSSSHSYKSRNCDSQGASRSSFKTDPSDSARSLRPENDVIMLGSISPLLTRDTKGTETGYHTEFSRKCRSDSSDSISSESGSEKEQLLHDVPNLSV
ncbi:glucagon receptor [Lingula anatina]|uniref:Glucagon receptor n=1 Tax=Lingula anatina TaxID=7574 RepID=A0A1S3HSY4_LINAN|nr:glucagon receptor [Lingula anatina]|eukprot:XP_013389152.1 glucagon receptor [Lingula anatina]